MDIPCVQQLYSPAERKLTSLLQTISNFARRSVSSALRYRSIDELVLHTGRVWDPAPYPQQLARGLPKRCFVNAADLSERTGWAYVEGFALVDDIDIPLAHAWCATGEGVVVDPTWQDGAAYLGIALHPDYRRAHHRESILVEHRASVSLLQSGLPTGAVLDVPPAV